MPGIITISDPQNLYKDSYAPAPKLDLTLRANGEESVQVMDALGNWYRAGLEAPKTAPTVTTGGGGSHPSGKYWCYRYVYVAKIRFPLVDNAVTGGASTAPRSNPSPRATANSTANTNTKIVDCPTTQRSDISHVWIYRSTYFSTAKEAEDFADAGNMFYIGEVPNDPNNLFARFFDSGAAAGLEQIENDNFPAPQFRLCVYAEPFFFGFGNLPFIAEITVNVLGEIELIATDAKWYDGRDGQIITMEGISSGGFDNLGSYYFKATGRKTGQLYIDIALTIPSGPNYVGTTRAKIRGPATTLYRSKPKNPFSWGSTDLIGELQVPIPNGISVAGGNGTAIAVIPNLNLLKLDTEGPNYIHLFNLKNAGTPNFEITVRSIPTNYSVSIHHSQFNATKDRGTSVLWGLDTKTFSIVESDGSSQYPVSSAVYKTLREMSPNEGDRLMFHGQYCPRLELNCIFIRTEGVENSINRMLYQHAPSQQWGMMDVFDIMCSALILDPSTNELKMFVGTSTGMFGEMFAKDVYGNWLLPDRTLDNMQGLVYGTATVISDTEYQIVTPNPAFIPFLDGYVGNWMTVILPATTYADTDDIRFARIANITSTTITVDRILTKDLKVTPFAGPIGVIHQFYIGNQPMELARIFNAGHPFSFKKIENIWTTWDIGKPLPIPLQIKLGPSTVGITAEHHVHTVNMQERDIADVPFFQVNNTYISEQQLILNETRSFMLGFYEHSYGPAQFFNYQIQLTSDGDSSISDRR